MNKMNNPQQPNDFQSAKISLLQQNHDREKASFCQRKQQDQNGPQQQEKPEPSKNFIISRTAIRNKLKIYSKSKLNNAQTQIDDEEQKTENKVSVPKIDQCQKILLYQFLNEINKIQKKQSKLQKQSRKILCKISFIVVLIFLFFVMLLKTFLFFSNQFIGTVVESFKDQLFDPNITNDQLQIQVFYIEQACFIVTTIVLFLFIIICLVLVNKFYMKNIRIYRRNRRVLNDMSAKKSRLAQQLEKIQPITIVYS